MAITATYDLIDKYIVRARLLTPLHVGSADKGTGEVLVHPVTDMPFIQASGIAGVFRECYRDLFDDPASELNLFGDNDKKAGRIRFTDGKILGKAGDFKIELRPRIRINRETGTSDSAKGSGQDTDSGQKFETEYIGAGAEIEFRVYIYDEQNTPAGDRQKVEQIFAQIHRRGELGGTVQFGGQKSNGCGFMEILSLRHHAFNMLKKEDRSAWTKEENEDLVIYEDRLKDVEDLQDETHFSTRAYTILLEANTEGSLLVKAISLTGGNQLDGGKNEKETEPDSVNMRNAQGHYIIPGSSVKGAVRAQFERIAAYLEANLQKEDLSLQGGGQKRFDRNTVIEDAFGRTGKKGGKGLLHGRLEKIDTGAAGNVRFYDVLVSPINGHEKEVIYNRIHIDRFTGGVMNKSLFKEQAVHGSLLIEAAVMKNVRHIGSEIAENVTTEREDAKRKSDRSCGMLILALRDLALGMYNLGSGYSVGRGFLCAKKMTILTGDGKKAELVFSPRANAGELVGMKLDDPEKIVEGCLKALGEPVQNTISEKAGKEGV